MADADPAGRLGHRQVDRLDHRQVDRPLEPAQAAAAGVGLVAQTTAARRDRLIEK